VEVPEFPSSELEAGQVSMPELGKMFKTKTEEKTGFLKKILYAGIPVVAIALPELLIFRGSLKEASIIYTLLLLSLSLSIAVVKNNEVRRIYQALLLLPIFRLVNLSMPVFFDTNLYSFALIYAPLAIPATIAIIHQKNKYEKKGKNFLKILIYLPFSIIAGLILAEAEYQLIGAKAIIPDLSPLNLLGLVIVMFFIVGLVEELIFRAILQTRMEEFLGSAGGILIASLLFGIMHSGYGTPYEMVYTFFVGILLGYIFHKTRSLPFVIMIHGSINVFLFGIIPYLGPGFGFM
jgi:membrane protease YdiL (CAAX protease family)